MAQKHKALARKPLDEFLQSYEKIGTRFGYYSALVSFLSIIYNFHRKNKRVSTQEKEQYEVYARQYLSEKRDHIADLIKFSKTVDKPTVTIRMYLAVVKEWLKCNKITIDYADEKKIRTKTPKRYPRQKEIELTPEIIKTILQHCDVRMRALCLCLLSGGLRINEALQITQDDLTEIEDMYKIRVPYENTKTGHERYTFCTPETRSALGEWMKVRGKYLNEKCVSEDQKQDDGRIFPFSSVNASISFINVLKRAGLYDIDPTTKRSLIHFHLFRGYFISNLKLKINPEVVEYLVHNARDIESIYRKYNFSQVLEEYKKGMEVLTFETDLKLKRVYNESVEKITTLETRQNDSAENISVILKSLQEYREENKDLRERIELLTDAIKINADVILKLNKYLPENELPIAPIMNIKKKK